MLNNKVPKLGGFNSKSSTFLEIASVTANTPIEKVNLNWEEKDLPERARTKHVHRLHPYLGKFVPQLAEIFLRKYAPKHVIDPFCGSGTTLVEANSLGIESFGCDISAFNCLISKVKTDKYDIQKLDSEIKHVLRRLKGQSVMYPSFDNIPDTDNHYLINWFATKARKQLLFFRSLIPDYEYQDLLKVILSRAARSARLTSHYDLDFPKKPQREPYHCYKHDRICKPTDDALQFLNRYCIDSLNRIKEFSKIRTNSKVEIVNADSRTFCFPKTDMVFTSPPYVGLIDYHRQHEYAYQLLNIESKEEHEIGAAFKGNSKKAQTCYIEGIGRVFSNINSVLSQNGVVCIVVNDKNHLYEHLAQKIGYYQESVVSRRVDRRTGRRSSDFSEQVLIWRKTK